MILKVKFWENYLKVSENENLCHMYNYNFAQFRLFVCMNNVRITWTLWTILSFIDWTEICLNDT